MILILICCTKAEKQKKKEKDEKQFLVPRFTSEDLLVARNEVVLVKVFRTSVRRPYCFRTVSSCYYYYYYFFPHFFCSAVFSKSTDPISFIFSQMMDNYNTSRFVFHFFRQPLPVPVYDRFSDFYVQFCGHFSSETVHVTIDFFTCLETEEIGLTPKTFFLP